MQAGVHSSMVTRSALLPLFREDSKSVAMMTHAMRAIKEAIIHLNPNQVPVMECDQPLFKLAKEIQWCKPEDFGEDKFVVLLGKLHIMMTLLKCLGNLLEGSGWVAALSVAEVASSGTADSFLKASHIKRCLRAHQVTACALYSLRKQAYESYVDSCCDEPPLDEASWIVERAKESPQFYFWDLILNTELDVLAWSRAVHSGDFDLYLKSLKNLMWLFFALDHHKYARAASVHLRDMTSLEDRHPGLFYEFSKGNFTLRPTGRPFSRIPIDEGHEQNNALIKGDGGAVGLTENPIALLRWMVAGPEMARVVKEFSLQPESSAVLSHHEDVPSKQRQFLKDVRSLVNAVTDMGNPFLEASTDLIVLDTRRIIDPEVASSLRDIKTLGQSHAEDFFISRFVTRSSKLDDTLKRNKPLLFRKRSSVAKKSGKAVQISSLKADRNLFSRLYIACQVREGDLEDFFRHENHAFPPALSDNGDIYFGKKSDLLECLGPLVNDEQVDHSMHSAEMIIFDGAAVVHFLQPNPKDTFIDFRKKFSQYINAQFTGSVRRIDVVFDEYIVESLKSSTRMQRGSGIRVRVEGNKQVPKNWSDFLRNADNKRELFNFLSEVIGTVSLTGKVVITCQENVASSVHTDLRNLMPCTHEEADYRMILHAADGDAEGFKRILIRTVDTDVVVLATAHFHSLPRCENLRVALGAGRSFRMVDVSSISQSLGLVKSKGLLFFHAFSGCDTTSAFRGKGKLTAFRTWKLMPELDNVFQTLSTTPTIQQVESAMPELERFVIIMYDKGSADDDVNTARLHLFAKKGRAIECVPPTKDALRLHVLRAAYQAGYVWGQALIKDCTLPSPSLFGWMKQSGTEWKVQWTSLPAAAQACSEIYSCKCSKQCGARCGCKQRNLPCTELCGCNCDMSEDDQ